MILLLLYVGSEGIVHAATRLANTLNLHKAVVGTVL
jgi:Ca2+/Na+ antiporter